MRKHTKLKSEKNPKLYLVLRVNFLRTRSGKHFYYKARNTHTHIIQTSQHTNLDIFYICIYWKKENDSRKKGMLFFEKLFFRFLTFFLFLVLFVLRLDSNLIFLKQE